MYDECASSILMQSPFLPFCQNRANDGLRWWRELLGGSVGVANSLWHRRTATLYDPYQDVHLRHLQIMEKKKRLQYRRMQRQNMGNTTQGLVEGTIEWPRRFFGTLGVAAPETALRAWHSRRAVGYYIRV